MRSERRQKPPEQPSDEPIRLQAFLARAGVASRRASEELILAGRVTVNGRAPELGSKVDPYLDTVRVDGRAVSLRPAEWVMLHKPRGYVTTREDPTGRKTVYDLLPPELHHLFHVGRLDRDSSGLLLLTNDGETANRLLHPRYGTIKVYRVDVEGRPSRETLEEMVHGVRLEDGIGQAVSVELKGEVDDGIYRLILEMQEGRNREVRRLLEAVGHPVRRLFRRQFGPLEIGRLPLGEWRRLSRAEIEQMGGDTGDRQSRAVEGRGSPRGRGGRPAEVSSPTRSRGGGSQEAARSGREKAPSPRSSKPAPRDQARRNAEDAPSGRTRRDSSDRADAGTPRSTSRGSGGGAHAKPRGRANGGGRGRTDGSADGRTERPRAGGNTDNGAGRPRGGGGGPRGGKK